MSNQTQRRKGLRRQDQDWGPAIFSLIEEAPLIISAPGREITLMATPGLWLELAAGYAVTMGWADYTSQPCPAHWQPAKGRVELELLPAQGPTEPQAKGTSGGPLGPETAPTLPPGRGLELETTLHLTRRMKARQPLFDLTGGAHAAALFDVSGKMLSFAEDVGRHNALDKAVGTLWLQGNLSQARAIALSGRCSLEMVLKTVRAGVCVAASVSAPTARAARAADEHGLCLIGFSRGRETNLYTHPERLTKNGVPL